MLRRFHMSQFYSDKELGVAYSWISAAQSISSVWTCLSACSSLLSRAPLLHHEQCPRVPAWMAYTSEILVRQCSTPASPPALCAWAWHSHLHSQLHASDTAAAAHDPGVQVLGSPIAALLLWMDGLFGLRGWQILFLAEGLPVSATAGALSQPPASIHLLVQTTASSACLLALSPVASRCTCWRQC